MVHELNLTGWFTTRDIYEMMNEKGNIRHFEYKLKKTLHYHKLANGIVIYPDSEVKEFVRSGKSAGVSKAHDFTTLKEAEVIASESRQMLLRHIRLGTLDAVEVNWRSGQKLYLLRKSDALTHRQRKAQKLQEKLNKING